MIKVVIIEDEKIAARRLERLLNRYDIEIIEKLTSVENSIKWFMTNEHPDLIFLDIQLNDGISFEIFEKTKIESSIIFTTAFDEYALKAFKLNSIDYILKPINEEELSLAIKKFKKYNKNNTSNINNSQLNKIKELLYKPEQKYKERFIIKIGSHIKTISSSEIECFYSENKATYIFTNSKKNYLIDYSLEQLEDLLSSTKFHRINRQFIINIDAIKDIISYSNSRLKITLSHYNNQEIIVSRERVKGFKLWLEE